MLFADIFDAIVDIVLCCAGQEAMSKTMPIMGIVCCLNGTDCHDFLIFL